VCWDFSQQRAGSATLARALKKIEREILRAGISHSRELAVLHWLLAHASWLLHPDTPQTSLDAYGFVSRQLLVY
jgi:hypothetical protein